MALTMCFVILPLTGFAVDIGMQRVARRDAQGMADAGAQDAARKLGVAPTTSRTDLETIARTTVRATPNYVGGANPVVTLYTGTLSSTFVSDQSLGCDGSPYNAYFTQTPVGSTPDAVLVTVTNSVSFNFVGSEGGVCRSAIARAYKTACMMMDSYAAALKSNDSTVLGPITKILGTSIDTTVLSGSGILTTDLDVLSFLNVLKTQLNLASIDQVLAANVTAAQLLQAEATALTQQGTTAAAALAALNSQITSRIGSIVNPTGFNVGTLLGITQGGASAVGTTINAFDLAAAAVQLANGTNSVAANVAIPTGLLGSTSVGLTIGSRPTRVCLGDDTKKLGQTSATATVGLDNGTSLVLNAVNSLVTNLQTVLGAVLCLVSCQSNVLSVDSVSATATASLAQASGKVVALNCDGGTPTSLSVQQDASLAPAKIVVTIRFKNVYTKRGLLGILLDGPTTTYPTLSLTLSTADPADPSQAATLLVPQDYDTGKPGPSGNLSIGTLNVETKTSSTDPSNVISGLLGGVDTVTSSVMNLLVTPLKPALTTLLTNLTTTLQSTVGLTIAGSTYTPLRTPSCGTPALAG